MIDRPSCRLSNRIRFGAAHGARSLAWSTVDLLLAWHLHVRVGLSGVQTGWLLCGFLLVGGVATFLVGLAFSRRGATGPAVVRAQWPAALATAVLFWAQFRVREVAAVIAVGLAFRLTYAVQDVAQNMLASLLPADEADARGYARLRVILSALSRCMVVAGFALVSPTTLVLLAGAVGLIIAVSATGLRGTVFPERPRDCTAGRAPGAIPSGLFGLLIGWVMVVALLPTVSRLLVFTPSVAGALPGGPWLLGNFWLGAIVGPLLRPSVRPVAMLALIAASATMIVWPAPIAVAGLWPIAGAAVHGAAFSIVGVQFWAATSRLAMADADRGRSSDGLVFGSVLLTIQIATAAGMLLIGPLIEGVERGGRDAPGRALALTLAGGVAITVLDIVARRRRTPTPLTDRARRPLTLRRSTRRAGARDKAQPPLRHRRATRG